MAASSDPPKEPEPGAVVDPEVLAERRARREDPSVQAEVERLRAEQALAERRNAELEAEVTLLTGEVDRRVAEQAAVTSQVARLRSALAALRARASTEEAHQAATVALLEELRVSQEQVEQALDGLRAERDHALERLTEEHARRESAEALLAEERERFAAEWAAADAVAHEERAALAAHLVEAQETMAALEVGVADADDALAERRDRARAQDGSRVERDRAVERLVGDLVGTVEGLRASFLSELERLEHERDAVAQPGDDAAAQAARLREEVERLRAAARPVSSVYDVPAGGARIPAADHPALARSEPADAAGTAPSVAAGDLDRAAARLRAAREAALDAGAPPARTAPRLGGLFASTQAPEELEAVEEPEELEELEAADAPPPAPSEGPSTPPAPAAPRALGVIHAALQPAATAERWLGDALADLEAKDGAAAERVLLAGLAVQGSRAAEDVVYELVLPVTGRHLVEVTSGGSVAVRPHAPGTGVRPAFRLTGGPGALAPLVAGAAPRRLPGVRVRGRRRHLRRLLRALEPVVGLPELRGAGAPLASADLLALLCACVPAGLVGTTGLRVAYLVAELAHPPVRVLVQARRAALEVVADPGADLAADATVSVEPQQLLGVLAGTEPAIVEGDQAAVGALHGWLRAAQGLPG